MYDIAGEGPDRNWYTEKDRKEGEWRLLEEWAREFRRIMQDMAGRYKDIERRLDERAIAAFSKLYWERGGCTPNQNNLPKLLQFCSGKNFSAEDGTRFTIAKRFDPNTRKMAWVVFDFENQK